MRSLIFNLSFYALTLILSVISIPVSLIFGKGGVRWLFWWWSKGTVGLVRWILGSRIEVRGLEHVQETPALLVSKHQSELDIPLMWTLFPNYGAVAMRELDRYPFVGRIVGQLGHIKVTVEGPRKNQLAEVIDGARRLHGEGRPILVYPEGTLMEPGRKLRYRGGIWHIYDDLKVSATPVAASLSLTWPRRDWRKFSSPCAIEFLEPIPPGLGKTEFMRLLEERIETASNRLIREHAEPERLEQFTFDYEKGVNIWSPRPDPDASE